MNIKLISISFYCIFLLVSSSCNKNHNSNGNSFYCKINGNNFSASTGVELFGSPSIIANNYSIQGFELFGSHNSDSKDLISKYIQINLPYLKSGGIYSLNESYIGLLHVDDTSGINYITDHTRTGSVTISVFDTVSHHYSGTFFFQAIDNKTGKLVNVTDGIFDVKK